MATATAMMVMLMWPPATRRVTSLHLFQHMIELVETRLVGVVEPAGIDVDVAILRTNDVSLVVSVAAAVAGKHDQHGHHHQNPDHGQDPCDVVEPSGRWLGDRGFTAFFDVRGDNL